MPELRWAPPRPDDDPEWAGLLAAMEVVDHRGETFELQDLADEWRSVWSQPETSSVMVWDGDELVGFTWLGIRPGQREHHQVTLWGGVRPSHRRQGLGTQLVAWSLARAKEIAPTFEPGLPVVVRMEAAAHQTDLTAVATRAGFRQVRNFLETVRATHQGLPEAAPVTGIELADWSPELDEPARLCHVEAFADHWGSEPSSPEVWAQWYTGHRNFRVDLSRLALDAASGEVVGVSLCSAYPQDWTTMPREAWINTLGTRRHWRGKGLGRWLMVESLVRIDAAADDFERAILGVDEENPSGALGLYRSLGFDEDVRAVATLTFEL